MKKLQKLTLKELSNSVEVIDETNAAILVGGSDNGGGDHISAMGWMEYYLIYGERLPDNSYYNPVTDTLNYVDLSSPQTPINLSAEELYSKACAEGYKSVATFFAAVGIVAADIYLLLYTKMPFMGPDVTNLDTWMQENPDKFNQ